MFLVGFARSPQHRLVVTSLITVFFCALTLSAQELAYSYLQNEQPLAQSQQPTDLGEAEKKVRQFLSEGGVASVLAAISALKDDTDKRLYFLALLRNGKYESDTLIRIAQHAASEIVNSNDLKETLTTIAGYQLSDDLLTEELIRAASGIEEEKERSSAYIAVIKRRHLHPAAARMVTLSLPRIKSDPERLSVMLEMARFGPDDTEVLSEYVAAIPTFESSGDKRQAIYALITRQPVPPELWVQMVYQANDLEDDDERSDMLVEMSELFESSNSVAVAYLEVVKSMKDSAAKGRSLSALLFKHNFNDDGILALIRLSKDIGSDVDRANVLVLLTRFKMKEEQLFFEYLRVVKSMNASMEMERSLRALLTTQEITFEALREAQRVAFRIRNEIMRISMLQLIASLEEEAARRL